MFRAWLRHRALHPFAVENRSKFIRRRPRLAKPSLEILEDRLTPAGNLTITDASVVDNNDKPLTTINVGQWVYIQVNFNATDLPANASYHIGITVNGLTLNTTPLNWGAGTSGTTSWILYWGAFQATPGTNQAIVTLNPDQAVQESTFLDNTKNFTFNATAPAVANVSYSVAQIRQAYGVNSIPNFGAATPDGTGQTIALVEAGNEPSILTDLDAFDQAMTLSTTSNVSIYQSYGPASSFASVFNMAGQNITANIANSGSNGVPAEDPSGHWEGEETLDVEWAHAMAPGARIAIIEVPDDDNWPTNLLTGDALAGTLPGVSSVSNSWGLTEWSNETTYDSSTFVTPSGHTGVTYLTASNDNGANVYGAFGPSKGGDGYYPATSPNVLSVGGTELTLNNNAYGSETAWSYPTPRTLNHNSTSYSQTGAWSSNAGGFSTGYGTASGGTSATATWTTTITPADTGWGTELSTTWTPSPGNATNATYSVYDGTAQSGTLLATVVIDQTKAPVGTPDGNFQFQELGVFFPTLTNGNGTLTVVLDASPANGTVVADAVGVAQAWASTGGPTTFEAEPSYQLPFQNTGFRTTPDVSLVASQNSGVTTLFQGNLNYGSFGTSLSSPCWAGFIAIVNQGRVAAGGTTLNTPANPQQTLQAIYSLPASDFYDITTGYSGFSAGPGYDQATGRGSPITNLLIPDLVNFGSASLSNSTVSIQPTSIQAGNSATVTLVAKDANGNQEATGGLTVHFGLGSGGSKGTFSSVTDHGDGTYTATFTGTSAGSGTTITATIDGSAVTSTLPTITVTTGAVSLSQSTVSILPATIKAGTTATATLTAKDAFGNQETGGGLTVLFGLGTGTSSGTFGNVTDNGNGTYTAMFTGNTAGAATTVMASIGGNAVTATLPTITVTPNTASLNDSTVSVAPGSIQAGGTATVTLTAKDAFGNPETSGGLTILFGLGAGTSSGSFSAVTDNKNGTYTATFTGTTVGSARTITAIMNGNAVTSTMPTITVTQGAASLSQSIVTIAPSSIQSGNTATITLTAKDAGGNQETNGGLTILFGLGAGTSSGTFSTVTDHGDGTYTATFTGTTAGTARTIAATINGGAVTSTLPAITVTAGPASLSKSTVGIVPTNISSGSTATVTVVAKDANGNQEPSGGLTILFGLASGVSSGTFSSVVDHGDGTYTATFTGVTAGSASTVTATIGGSAVTSTLPLITVKPGPFSFSKSVVTVAHATIQSGSTTTVTLTAEDANGNHETSGGLPIAFGLGAGSSSGTFSSVTDNGDGTYTATFTGTTAGSARTITATSGGQAITSTLPSVTVTPGVATHLKIAAIQSNPLVADSPFNLSITVLDAGGNVATGYTGTLAVHSSDSQAKLPGNHTFSASDQGTFTFSVTMESSGAQTLTVVDTVNSAIAVTANTLVVVVSKIVPVNPVSDIFGPRPNASQNEAFIKGLYRLILGRDADAGGLGHWISVMSASGTSLQERQQIVQQGFWNSQENRTREVNGYYQTYLGRKADPQGLSFWIGQLQNGEDETAVVAFFLLQQEAAKLSNSDWITNLFEGALGRAPDSAGFTYWLGQLNSNQQTRTQIEQEFVFGTEAAGAAVDSFYIDYLQRISDSNGRGFWVNAISSGNTTYASVAQGLLASDEFFADAAKNVP